MQLPSELPVVQAPLAGGPSTPALTAAVSGAGAGATAAGDTSVPNLWTGTGWRQVRAEPAAAIVARIAAEAGRAGERA